MPTKSPINTSGQPATVAYRRRRGTLYVGDSLHALGHAPLKKYRGKVQLVFTSPPFPLNRKKKYGNLQGEEYVEWLAAYAPRLTDCLTDDGSIVIEVGNGWDAGQPTVSTLAIEALLAFKKKAGLHLCQEFICFNPARLPSPAQWVTIERCRVKDAFTRVWWMSPTPRPKADNGRVLTEYSGAMRKLLERGTYNPGTRPSEHQIGETSFLADNGGAIPPNVLMPSAAAILQEILAAGNEATDVLSIANTSTADPYQRYCRENDIPQHPARMPMKLVQFFVDFLTEPGDLVLDPFAGSNSTGFVADLRNRRWVGIEADEHYAKTSEQRFKQFELTGINPLFGESPRSAARIGSAACLEMPVVARSRLPVSAASRRARRE
jgi:site-specific DNA-methyltransferase (cytosine-N4-specific)